MARIVENPSETKKFTFVDWAGATWNDKVELEKEQLEKVVDALMKWQEFMYDNPMGARYGGGGNVMDLGDGHFYRHGEGLFCKWKFTKNIDQIS